MEPSENPVPTAPHLHRDSWQSDSPQGRRASPASPERAGGPEWGRAPTGEEAFSRPIGGASPSRVPHARFAPLALTLRLDERRGASVFLGGALLQRRPIGSLRAFRYELAIFTLQSATFSVATWIIRRHDRRD